MSASGGGDIVHGAQTPTPKWWRRYRDIPLVVLIVLSLAAAIVGWVTQSRIDAAGALPAGTTPSSSASGEAAGACRPALPAPSEEPWIGDDSAASATWEANAPQLADPVVLGRDGWAFYNDQIEENFSQAIGRRFLTVAEVDAWHDYFGSLAAALADQGIELYIEVSPSAASVYPEKLPEWTEGIVGSTALDQLLAASPDLPILDFRNDLRLAADDNPVYTPVNSHWTDWGGYIAWQRIAACHDALDPAAASMWVPAVDGVQSTQIYNEYAAYGVPDAGPAWTAPVFAEPLADVEVTAADGTTTTQPGDKPVDLSVLPASTTTSDAQTTQQALILRDSMGSALTPYWDQVYAKTWQIQHRYDDWSNPPNYRALVQQYHPDVVIVQLAERHLANAPAKGVGTGY